MIDAFRYGYGINGCSINDCQDYKEPERLEITVKGYTTGIICCDEERLDFQIRTNIDRPSSCLAVTFNKKELGELIDQLKECYGKMKHIK